MAEPAPDIPTGFSFSAELRIVGVNPYVDVPAGVLAALFARAGRSRGPVPVRGTLNGAPYRQTLVRYAGQWRLYVNTAMLKDSPRRIGELLALTVDHDPEPRLVEAPAAFAAALAANPDARAVYDALPPSRRLEIDRYLARLKTPAALERNIDRAVGFLLGRGRFVGRDRP